MIQFTFLSILVMLQNGKEEMRVDNKIKDLFYRVVYFQFELSQPQISKF